MGASISKIKTNKLHVVDYGSVVPLGLYEEINEQYDLDMIQQLIISRKLSPFYKGVSDPNEIGDIIDYIKQKKKKVTYNNRFYKLFLLDNQKKISSLLYNDSIECPICFLYYPANINFTRCCDQPICTECFVQMKKGSSDMVCPFCMTDKFGVIYPNTLTLIERKRQTRSTTSGLSMNPYTKRKIIPSNHPTVVLLDHMKNITAGSSTSSSSNNNIQFLFHSRPLLSTISINNSTMQDLMFYESIRHK